MNTSNQRLEKLSDVDTLVLALIHLKFHGDVTWGVATNLGKKLQESPRQVSRSISKLHRLNLLKKINQGEYQVFDSAVLHRHTIHRVCQGIKSIELENQYPRPASG